MTLSAYFMTKSVSDLQGCRALTSALARLSCLSHQPANNIHCQTTDTQYSLCLLPEALFYPLIRLHSLSTFYFCKFKQYRKCLIKISPLRGRIACIARDASSWAKLPQEAKKVKLKYSLELSSYTTQWLSDTICQHDRVCCCRIELSANLHQ